MRTWLMCRLGYHHYSTRARHGKYDLTCTRCGDRLTGLSHEEAGRLVNFGVGDARAHRDGALSLDVGCGFLDGVQVPVYASVSLDLNMCSAEPGFIGKLRASGSSPVCGDAQSLPFRSRVFHRGHWRAVLEHLPDPHRAIVEGLRVLVDGGEAEVVLPMITSQMRYYLVILFTGFPFSLAPIAMKMFKAYRYWYRGGPHISDVKPRDLKRYYRRVDVVAQPQTHKWFTGPWGRAARLLTNGRPLPDIQGQYLIRCR